MNWYCWVFIGVIFLFACQNFEQKPEQECAQYTKLKAQVEEYLSNGPLDKRVLEHINDENKWKDVFRSIAFNKRIDSLKSVSLNEPVFEKTVDDYTAFRINNWQAFRDYEILIRVENAGGFVKLVHKKYENNPFGEKKGKPAYTMISADSLILKNLTWKELDRKIQEEEFWELIYDDGVQCLDGESWILEGVAPLSNFKDEKHIHTISRSCPDDYQTIVKIGQYLFDLADIEA